MLELFTVIISFYVGYTLGKLAALFKNIKK